jgi:YD repeat-containing protein
MMVRQVINQMGRAILPAAAFQAALLLLIAASASAQIPTPLTCGVPQDGVLNQTQVGVDGYPYQRYSIDAQAGDAVIIHLIAYQADPGFQYRLSMTDQYRNPITPRQAAPAPAAGAPPVPDPTKTPYFLSRTGNLEFDLTADGPYTIQVQSNGKNSNFTVEFSRLNRPCSATPLRCGQSASGLISLTGQMDAYQYTGHAGDVISIRALKVATAKLPIDPNAQFFVAVYGPDGRVMTATNGVPAAGVSASQSLSLVNVKVVIGGPMTVLIFEASGVLGGGYAISATNLNGGCGGPALSCGSTADGQIAASLNLSSFTIQASSGDVYLFRLARADTSGSFYASAEIYDSSGTQITTLSPNSSTQHALATNVLTIAATGTYLVLVGGPTNGSTPTGGFSLSAASLNHPCANAQVLSSSSIVDGSINGLLRTAVYSLPGVKANDAFLLRLLNTAQNSSFRPRVDVYDGQGNPVTNTGGLGRLNFIAPSDGTYTLLLTDSFDYSQSGTYSLSLLRLNRPSNAGTLTCGAPATGGFTRSLQASVYTYTGSPGDSFSVRMQATAGSLQPSVEVYDAQGNLASQAAIGNSANVDVFKPAGGVYTVVALDASTNPVAGAFFLDLLRTRNACGPAVPIGQTVSGVLSGAAPYLSYTLPLSNGDALSLRSASFTAGFAPQMELYDPDGARVDSSTFAISRRIQAAGNYTVLVSAATPQTGGGYALAWQLLNNPAATAPLQCGGSTTASLSAANEFRYYLAAANAGDIVRMIFTRISDNFNPQVELYDPTGLRLTANSDITQTVTATGNYLVVVSPGTSNGETGSYTIAYQRPNNPCSPAALTCGQTTLRPVNIPGQFDAFTFNGTGGDQTTVKLASRTGAYSPFVEMYNSAGRLLSTSGNGMLRSVLTADGIYLLLVRDRSGANLGSYRVSVQDDFNPCPVTDTEPPTITLLRPTGGEVLPGGATFRIQWQSDDNVGVATHDIALSTDAGKTFSTPIAGGLNGNTQIYDWSVPPDIAPSRTAVIRVTATDAAGNAQSAASDLLTLIGSGFTPNASANFTYDSLNRLIQAVLGDGRTVQYAWDPAGNLIAINVTGQ